jgi:hypothetical protein
VKKTIWLVFFLAPICLIVSLAILKTRPHTPPASPPYPDVASKWEALRYEPIEDSPSFRERAEQIPIEADFELTPAEKSALLESAYDALMAFRTGTYETYRKFRTPIPARFNSDLILAEREYFAKYLKKPSEVLPSDDEAFFKLLWERSSGGGGWSNVWEGVSIEASKIWVRRTSALPPGLLSFAQTNDNIGVFRQNPNFAFERTPDSILKTDRRLTFATIYIVVKHAPPDPPYGKHIRYYWDGHSSHWTPWEYVSAYLRKREHEILW